MYILQELRRITDGVILTCTERSPTNLYSCSFDPVPEKTKDDQMQRVPSGVSQASGSSAVSRALRSSKHKAVEVAEESQVEEVEAPATKHA